MSLFFVHLSDCLSVGLFVWLILYLSIYFSLYLSLFMLSPSICLSALYFSCLFDCSIVHLSAHLSNFPTVCVNVPMSFCAPASLSWLSRSSSYTRRLHAQSGQDFTSSTPFLLHRSVTAARRSLPLVLNLFVSPCLSRVTASSLKQSTAVFKALCVFVSVQLIVQWKETGRPFQDLRQPSKQRLLGEVPQLCTQVLTRPCFPLTCL